MSYAIAALAFLGLPLALLVFTKANAGIMFFAACAGIVLLSSLDMTFIATAGSVVPGEGEATVRLMVVLGALTVAGLAFRGYVKGFRLVSNGLVVLLLAAMLWLQLPPLVGASWLTETMMNDAWYELRNFQSLIIASGLAISLLVIMTKEQRHKSRATKH